MTQGKQETGKKNEKEKERQEQQKRQKFNTGVGFVQLSRFIFHWKAKRRLLCCLHVTERNGNL